MLVIGHTESNQVHFWAHVQHVANRSNHAIRKEANETQTLPEPCRLDEPSFHPKSSPCLLPSRLAEVFDDPIKQ